MHTNIRTENIFFVSYMHCSHHFLFPVHTNGVHTFVMEETDSEVSSFSFMQVSVFMFAFYIQDNEDFPDSHVC